MYVVTTFGKLRAALVSISQKGYGRVKKKSTEESKQNEQGLGKSYLEERL